MSSSRGWIGSVWPPDRSFLVGFGGYAAKTNQKSGVWDTATALEKPGLPDYLPAGRM